MTDTLHRALLSAISAMEQAREDIEGYIDVNDSSDGDPTPNKAMSADMALERAIDEAKGALAPTRWHVKPDGSKGEPWPYEREDKQGQASNDQSEGDAS